MDTKDVDVLIIGAGPAGKTAAIYTARADLKTVVLTGLTNPGGALMNTTDIENFPGFEKGIGGIKLMDIMQKQAERFGATFELDEAETFQIQTADKSNSNRKVITTTMGETYLAKVLIVATGSLYRKLNIPGEKELAGHGVSYCATCDGAFFKDQDVIVVGGGDTALEEALYLSNLCKTVTIIHRRDVFRATKILVERAEAINNIYFKMNSTCEEILPLPDNSHKVGSAKILNKNTNQIEDISVTGVFVAIGADPTTQKLKDILDLDLQGYIKTDGKSSKTGIPGVFAAGDCIDPDYRQAVVAAGSGAKAGIDTVNFLTA
ncbi:MAG: thioredoxin-disulfide reductase [Candidatus Ancillula sp.]|jgi:thioredoxin reductase (NADPH)|nr:thioredoxin-disulfide reductase [Candidatus Ancillula sp.]